jgi:hypothetical protein
LFHPTELPDANWHETDIGAARKPKEQSKNDETCAVCPNGSHISITAGTVRVIAKIAMLYRPYLSARHPGIQRPNTEPKFSTGIIAEENKDEKPTEVE